MGAHKIFDADFVDRLKANPADTLREIGIDPTPEAVAKVNQLDSEVLKEAIDNFRTKLADESGVPDPHYP